MARRRGAGAVRALAVALVAVLLLAGCEDSAAGFGAGIGKAIFLLLFVGLILPALVIGAVVGLVLWARQKRDRSGPP